MQSVGTPELLLKNNTSPHDYNLKPSDIKLINSADLVIWGGPELEGYLQKPLSNATADKDLNLATLPGLKLLPLRTNTNWEEEHDHEHNHDHHHHAHGTNDAHFWLDPYNATVITTAIAKRLAEIDPAHAATYHKNAAEFATQLKQQQKIWQKNLAPVKNKAFIVFHDAYQYFDDYFHLNGVGSISLNPEIPPSAQRIQQIHDLLQKQQVSCIFSEPQFNNKIIATLTEGINIYHGELDPLGQDIDIGPNGYFVLIDKLVNSFAACGKERNN